MTSVFDRIKDYLPHTVSLAFDGCHTIILITDPAIQTALYCRESNNHPDAELVQTKGMALNDIASYVEDYYNGSCPKHTIMCATPDDEFNVELTTIVAPGEHLR